MKGLSPEEKRDLILSVGSHRAHRRLQPVEVSSLYQKSLSAGETFDELSKETTLSKRVIQKFISLLSLPPDICSLVGWGSDPTSISFTTAAEISRLENEDEKRLLAKSALEHQISVPEMKQVIQIRYRSDKTIRQSIDAVIKQRPVIERRHLIIGKLLSGNLTIHLNSLSQSERNQILDKVLVQHDLGKPTYGGKLAIEYFYIVGDANYHEKIISLPNGFEGAITDYLLQELKIEK